MSYTLGLDLGTNSIGWALIKNNSKKEPSAVLDCGSRIFQEAVEAKTRIPKNQARQISRSARRLISRRKERKQKLQLCLIEYNMLPVDPKQIDNLLINAKHDPYQLRCKALDEKISIEEFSRILFHINKRRGFKSNRKAQLVDLVNDPEVQQLIQSEEKTEKTDKETSELKQKMTDLKQKIIAEKKRTLGEYLSTQTKKRVEHHPTRELYELEFDMLWEKQQSFYPDILTNDRKAEIANIIFKQRPLKVQKHLIGKCTFEPSCKRAAKARLEYQEYRIHEQLARLQILDPITMKMYNLTDTQKFKLLDKLSSQGEMNFNGARKLLGLHGGETFNLENEKNSKLNGNKTLKKIKDILNKDYPDFSNEQAKQLMEDLLSILRKDVLYRRLKNHWQFTPELAYQLATTDFEAGYASLSLRAIKKILPQLKRGLNYHDAVIEAGYEHDYQTTKTVTNELPSPNKTRNPVVDKALNETRKLINAIIMRYGKPEKIRIELARELKLSPKKLAELNRQQLRNQKENEDAEKFLITEGIYTSKEAIKFNDLIKYRLWKEADKHCPYTGQYISLAQLFSNEVEIEHIIPFSRSLDNSYMNKTICHAKENSQRKGNQLPYEAYSADEVRYNEIKNRIKNFPQAKKRKFYQQSVDEDKFVNRQLVDTGYIAKEINSFLQILGCVTEVTKGSATAFLRHKWGLNALLSNENDEKNRADHRHHAIDAIVIALTTRALLQKISRQAKQLELKNLRFSRLTVPEPWPEFLNTLRASINDIVISHARSFRVRGPLHEATIYGYDKGKDVYLIRKPLAHFKDLKQLEKVQDDATRKKLKEHLANYTGDFKAAFQNPDNLPIDHNGNTIYKVRIREKMNQEGMIRINKEKNVTQNFSSGSNHHVVVFENIHTNKREWKMWRRFDVAQRCRLKQPVILKNDPDFPEQEGWKFVDYYAINETFLCTESEKPTIYRVQKMSLNDIVLQPHTYSLTDYVKGKTVAIKSANATKAFKKLHVDRLGKMA